MYDEKHTGSPSDITPSEHEQIEKKLKDPKNGLRGYVELLEWMGPLIEPLNTTLY